MVEAAPAIQDALHADEFVLAQQVERFFRDLTMQSVRRGVFRSVSELIAAIEEHIAAHNANPKPFIWTAKASDILEKVTRARSKLQNVQSA